jgi:hypothetical protein
MTATQQHQALAERVAETAKGCAGVAELGGRSIATYLPGRRVPGVDLDGDTVRIDVVARWGYLLTAVADDVRRAVSPLVDGRPIDVVIDDVDLTTVVDIRGSLPETASA